MNNLSRSLAPRHLSALLSSLLFVSALLGAGCGRDSLLRSSTAITLDAGNGDGSASDGNANTDGGGADAMRMIKSISIDPPMATLVKGSTRPLVVTALYIDGTTGDVTAQSMFSTSAAPIASVSTGGVVMALAPGNATITATLGPLTATAAITVSTATVTGLAVLPETATTPAGTTLTFTADATLSDGTHQDVTASANWMSSATPVATVVSGVATAIRAGTTTITASFSTGTGMPATGTATLTVTAGMLTSIQVGPVDPSVGINTTLNFTATGIYSDGTRADLTNQVAWSTSVPTVVSISPAGRAQTLARGMSTITATAPGGQTGSSTVTVTPATLVSITVAPAMSTVMVGGTIALRATGNYSDNSTVDLTTSVTWTTSAMATASVSNAAGTAGTVTGLAVGTATIIATSGTVAGRAAVTVSAAALMSILVTPAMASTPVGTTVAMTATGRYTDGTTRDITTQVAWNSTPETVATVSNIMGTLGVVTAVSVGTARVTATLNGIVGTATISVVAATLQSITVTPANATTTALLRSSYKATGSYSNGTMVDITTQVTWATGNPAIAAISNVAGAQGQLVARTNGTTTVTATLGTVVGTTNVTVMGRVAVSLAISPIAPTVRLGTGNQRFVATEIFSDGTQANVSAQATWTSSAPAVATINNGGGGNRGVATPVAVGTTTITATFMGLTATTTFTVTNAVITSITVTPIAPLIPVGTVVQFVATAIFSDNTTQNVTAGATWQSSAPGVLGVTTAGGARGRGTGIAAGTATVTATFMGISGSTTAMVTNAIPMSISVRPAGITLAVGARRQFTAQEIFSDGTSRDVTATATWQSLQPGIAGVSDAGGTRGLVTGVAAGTATIQATLAGLSGSVAVTVSPGMLTSIQVTPFNQTVAVGASINFLATGLLSDGTSVDLTATASWVSSDPTIAAVSNAAGTRGLVTALAAGSVTITATSAGVSGSTMLTVSGAKVTAVQVTPFNPRLPAGFAQPLAATALFSDGTSRDVTATATWTSGSPTVATVSDAAGSKGLLTAVAAGTSTISAAFSGVTGSTTATVIAGTLSTLTITPPNQTVRAGSTVPFTATGTFSDGSSLDVTAFVTWTSSDTATADVSNANGSRGQATAFAAGTTTIQAQRGTVTATTTLTVN